jgi:hypothetical protein
MEAKTHSTSSVQACQNCKKSFEITNDDFGFYEKIGVPAPTFCPDCRYQRRISDRNEWELYRRNCSKCNLGMVSIYNPQYKGPVYCNTCWWADDWDRFQYGVDFDFSRPFFEQFKELRERTPKLSIAHPRCVNSEYTNQSQDLKNCYMVFGSDQSEDSMYGSLYFSSKECVDCNRVLTSELLYECINCTNCSRSAYLEDCSDCTESYFLKDCKGCISCFGSVNLRNKSYHWFNEQLTKEEYKKRLSEFSFSRSDINEALKKWYELSLKLPKKYYQGQKIVNSTGSYIDDLKNCKNNFCMFDAEDSHYCQDAWHVKNCMDVTEMAFNELDYEMEGIGYSARSIGCSRTWNIYDSCYTENCFSCDSVFGCVALNKNKYCILNKQYNKEDYGVLKTKIIEHMKKTGEWGEFYPTTISPFAYNETVAQHYFPMTKQEVLAKGWRWYDRDSRDYKVTLNHIDVPTTISLTGDEIVKEIISCSSQDNEEDKRTHTACVTAFRITSDELNLHRKMNMPLPEQCFPCRFRDRLNRRTPRKLWHRKCMNEGCMNEFETSYSPDRPEIIYCESCYQKEVL